MASLPCCTVGKVLGQSDVCHKTIYTRTFGLISIQQLTQDKKALLGNRTGIASFGNEYTICHHHHKLEFDKFEFLQRTCCDPFGTHKAPVKSSLRTVTLEHALSLQQSMGIQVKAGWKICPRCYMKTTEICSDSEEDEFVLVHEKEDILNDSILSLPDVSPIKVSKVSRRDRLGYTKRKFKQIMDNSQQLLADCTAVPVDVLS